jgi:selenocysteine lyase/cysteine desulfurase
VPLGSGILYVRKERIKNIWPLLAENDSLESIGRLNHIGTHPVHTDLAISDAIDYYQELGAEKKETRLRYLQQYWTTRVRGIGKIIVNTPVQPERSCAIANVGIDGMKPGVLAETLLKKYQIYTVAIDGANVHGCRITPNVFTLTKELDVLINALKEMS